MEKAPLLLTTSSSCGWIRDGPDWMMGEGKWGIHLNTILKKSGSKSCDLQVRGKWISQDEWRKKVGSKNCDLQVN
jgi:hypothetical protein